MWVKVQWKYRGERNTGGVSEKFAKDVTFNLGLKIYMWQERRKSMLGKGSNVYEGRVRMNLL